MATMKVAATTAMALASRASRACDVCASKSARWYCGADAAFLCDRCDTQVHSANALAQRHERVRLTPTGAPASKVTDLTKKSTKPTKTKKITHSPPLQVLPARKRTRTSRPHPHRPRQEEEEEEEEAVTVKVEEANNNLFADFFDTEDFLIDHPQEVPSCTELNLSHEYSEPSSSSLQSPGSSCFSPGESNSSFHGDDSSFAAYFKGKAALTEDVVMSSDEFEAAGLVPAGIDIICCDADGNISLAGDACFIPGDIPGLDAFDDCSLSFDLAASGAFEGEHTAAGGILASKNVETDQYATGPFAKYFVTKKATSSSSSPEIIKSEAREILRCCTDGETAPTLRLNYEEIIAAWSDRGEPWVNPECNAATDVGIVPDMGLEGACDDIVHEGADDGSSREARVMRYKEKRRSRLFSKTIRYEVRKLNAERRPRLKGRFVKRTNS